MRPVGSDPVRRWPPRPTPSALPVSARAGQGTGSPPSLDLGPKGLSPPLGPNLVAFRLPPPTLSSHGSREPTQQRMVRRARPGPRGRGGTGLPPPHSQLLPVRQSSVPSWSGGRGGHSLSECAQALPGPSDNSSVRNTPGLSFRWLVNSLSTACQQFC